MPCDVEDDRLRARAADDRRGLHQIRERCAADNREQGDGDFDDDDAGHHTQDRLPCRVLVLGGEELLVHAALAEDQQEGGRGHPEHPEHVVAAERLHVLGRQGAGDGADPAELEHHVGQCEEDAQRDDEPVEHVYRDDRNHPCRRREQHDHDGCDVHARFRADRAVGDDAQDPAASSKLVGRDRHVREDDRDRPQNPSHRVVALLQEVRDGVLGDPANAGGEEERDDEAQPAPRAEPELRDPGPVGQTGASEQGSRADPGADERADEQRHRHRPPRDHEVVVALHASGSPEAHAEENQGVEDHYGQQQVHPAPPAWFT